MPDTIQVKIANVTVRVPVYLDEKTTRALAEQVSDHIKEIEGTASRIDTQAFALQAAHEFAAELHALKREQERDTRDLVVTLDAIATRLKELTDEFAPRT